MADTTFIKRIIEPYLRLQWALQYPGHRFKERSVALPDGSFKCDAVSVDGSIVGLFSCNRAKTATGNENTGGVRKAFDDIHCLKYLPARTRLLVCTTRPFGSS